MTRLNCRHTPRLECLETRTLLRSGGPSALQQYTLELLNEARTNPSAMAQRVTTNLDSDVVATLNQYGINPSTVRNDLASASPKPPLAWNDLLAQAAQDHSQDMADHNFQGHNGSDGSTPDQRLNQVGYTSRTSSGENAFAYAASVDQAMEAFLIDWGNPQLGHRKNILQPDTSPADAYREVGVGIATSSNSGKVIMTQDFGSRSNVKAELLGVAYDDPNHTHFYAQGEGRSDVTVTAVNEQSGQQTSVETWDQGGYQMPLDPGTYKVTATVGDKVVRSQEVTIGNLNVKVDFDLSDPWQAPSPDPGPNAVQQNGSVKQDTSAKQDTPAKPMVLSNGTVQSFDPTSEAQQLAPGPNAPSVRSWTTWTTKAS